MITCFISGSRSIDQLDPMVKTKIESILDQNHKIIIGDANGVDSLVQKFLFEKKIEKVTIYHSGKNPRNNIGNWNTHEVDTCHPPGSRAFFTAKDNKMVEAASYGLMIWDTKSLGTLNNVINLLACNIHSIVFINSRKEYKEIINACDLEELVNYYMSKYAQHVADVKINVEKRINAIYSRDH